MSETNKFTGWRGENGERSYQFRHRDNGLGFSRETEPRGVERDWDWDGEELAHKALEAYPAICLQSGDPGTLVE